ncbi:DUF2939 domain-containing protein, partial [Erythrobacter sp. R86502]|uniref:DUF2939 domain-containing protein n=1 Tax=Erythrobacter sp. R86502 TaxID=3093846 RepID=UPI0036D3404C
MTRNRTFGLVALALTTATACYLYFLSPHVALSGMKAAFEERDHETFSSYIDFDRLKSSLREESAAQAAAQIAESDDVFGQIGTAAGAAFADTIIDRLVSPAAIRVAFQRGASKKDKAAPATALFSGIDGEGNIDRNGLSQFKLVSKEGIVLVFARSWFSCELVGLEFPTSTVRSETGATLG